MCFDGTLRKSGNGENKKMSEEKCSCPYCGMDIEEFIKQEIRRRASRKNAEKARAAISRNPQARERQVAGIKKWRKENAEEMRKSNIHASRSRTAETFKRQSETIRETNRRKALVFAELLMAAKSEGKEITPALESELQEQARQIVKDQRKAERRKKKSSE
jgi:hypothetical protein